MNIGVVYEYYRKFNGQLSSDKLGSFQSASQLFEQLFIYTLTQHLKRSVAKA